MGEKMVKEVETIFGKFKIEANERLRRAKLTYEGSRDDLSRDDLEAIKSFLKDLGKFETISKGINALTNSIGLTEIKSYDLFHDDFEEIIEYQYNMERNAHDFFVYIRNEKTKDKRKIMDENVFKIMIENIEKYKSLKDSFEILNQIFVV